MAGEAPALGAGTLGSSLEGEDWERGEGGRGVLRPGSEGSVEPLVMVGMDASVLDSRGGPHACTRT